MARQPENAQRHQADATTEIAKKNARLVELGKNIMAIEQGQDPEGVDPTQVPLLLEQMRQEYTALSTELS